LAKERTVSDSTERESTERLRYECHSVGKCYIVQGVHYNVVLGHLPL